MRRVPVNSLSLDPLPASADQGGVFCGGCLCTGLLPQPPLKTWAVFGVFPLGR
jgi:hypothetical protein